MIPKNSKGRFVKGQTLWNKGLVKETDMRVKKYAANVKKTLKKI